MMVEVIYSNLDNNQSSKDLDKIQCMWSTWQKFVWNTLTPYASTLEIIDWTDIKVPTVDRRACQLWQFEENLSSSPNLWACVYLVLSTLSSLSEDPSLVGCVLRNSRC